MHNAETQFDAMDRMYRYQRYFYDLTRKYYLLGRDRLIREMVIGADDRVLEIGCGTARNLIALDARGSGALLFGLDASAEMLKTAAAKIERKGITGIRLETALADEFSCDGTFGLDRPFDAVFFSYAVSIIPPWKESIINAHRNLKPGGTLYIVDFFDQRELPRWFASVTKAWLRQFHVKYPEELIPFLENLAASEGGELTIKPLYRRYALIAELRKKA